MRILTINAGSSSIKFKVFDNEKEILKGIVDAIGLPHSKIKYSYEINNIKKLNKDKNNNKTNKTNKKELEINKQIKDHKEAIKEVVTVIKETIGIKSINAVAHRVVHGGDTFKETTIITKEVIKKLKELIPLAPLHNPHNIKGIEEISKILKVPQVAVFDTAFHSTIKDHVFLYAIPLEFYEKYKIRRYGFHGTSHKYVMQEALKIDNSLKRIITCHLGNGASITAIKDKRSIETSMGFTPLEGLIMGTRSGDIDPAIIPYLMEKENLSPNEINKILNKKSGLLALSRLSSDMRILLKNRTKNKYAKLAIDAFVHRVTKYIGAYIAILNGIDAIIFTGGIGENSSIIREKILKNFSYLGIKINKEANKRNEAIISTKDSKVKIFVIKTNEELQMVRETIKVLKNKNKR